MNRSAVGLAASALVVSVAMQAGSRPVAAADEDALIGNLAQEPELAAFQERARHAGALGFYVDESTDALVAVVPRAARRAFDLADLQPPAVPVTVRWTDLDKTTVAVARARLHEVMDNLAPAGGSMAIHFDARSERISVTSTVDSAVLQKALGDSWRVVDYQHGEVELLAGRLDDFAPYVGAARIEFSDPDEGPCTSGFTAVSGSTRAMVIPAHCGLYGNTVRTGTGKSIGTVGSDRHCGPSPNGDNSDFQFVRGGAYTDDIYVGTTAAGSRADVTEWGTPGVGTAYRYSGSYTYERSNQVVSDTDGELWIHEGNGFRCAGSDTWWLLHLIVFSNNGVCNAVPGDSGSPFYLKRTSSPYTVGLRGMVVARNAPSNTVCYAVKLSTINSLSGYQPLLSN